MRAEIKKGCFSHMTTRICPHCGHPAHSAAEAIPWTCPYCGRCIPVSPQEDRDEYIKSFPRRPRVKAWRYIRAGIRIGLTLITAVAVVMLLVAAGKTFLTRPGHPGGEILVPGLIYLVGWIGWQLRRLWDERKGGTSWESTPKILRSRLNAPWKKLQ